MKMLARAPHVKDSRSEGVPPGDFDAARLAGKSVAMVVFSQYPWDPRPRRAAEALADAGMHVDLVCLRGRPEEPARETAAGVNVRRLPIRHRRSGFFAYAYQYSAFILLSALILAFRTLSRRYDLVYVHNMPDVLVLAGLVPKLFGAKVILDLHDPMPELMMTIFGAGSESRSVGLLKLCEKWSTRFVDSVITVNRACAHIFGRRSCPSEKITVVMNSPDHNIFGLRPVVSRPPAANGHQPFVLMYHGSIVERNGLDLAVEALALARGSVPRAELRVYGGPANAFLERVKESVRRHGMEEAVRFLGPKSAEEIANEILACDVGLIPNRRSIFTELNTPTRIFEYLALGKPVIAPRSPGIRDYFDERSLIFFELGDAEDLARQIESVFSRYDEALEITRRGQQVHHAHRWQQERLKLLEVVAGLVG